MRQGPVIVGLGETLWDEFPRGARFGGAPANFACHASMLGANAFMVSQVGRDERGDAALAELQSRGVNTEFVKHSNDFPTGRVKVELDPSGKPEYEIIEHVAWDYLSWDEKMSSLATKAAAVCFGTLGQRCETSRATIQRFVAATPPQCRRVFDVNLRQQFYSRDVVLASLELATVLKLNDEELPLVASLCDLSSDDNTAEKLLQRFQLELIALTRGAAGSLLLTSHGCSEVPTPSVEVVDTVGAGDSFTAAMVMGLLAGHDLDTVNHQAARVAAFVCTQSGATPRLPDDLRR